MSVDEYTPCFHSIKYSVELGDGECEVQLQHTSKQRIVDLQAMQIPAPPGVDYFSFVKHLYDVLYSQSHEDNELKVRTFWKQPEGSGMSMSCDIRFRPPKPPGGSRKRARVEETVVPAT